MTLTPAKAAARSRFELSPAPSGTSTAGLFRNDLTMISIKPTKILKPFGCNLHAILYPLRTWGHNTMLDGIYDEETALRRRLLFRLLRGFNFDAPRHLGEAISDPVPKALITPEYQLFAPERAVSGHSQT